MRPWLREKSPGLHRFLTRADSPYPAVREVLAGSVLILSLLGTLYVATGQPILGGYPVVVVTSGSMMHCQNAYEFSASLGRTCVPESYGRLGTIDPGDLVFVRHVGEREDVTTLAQARTTYYEKGGDVVVYRPGGSTASTPIIHRALFYVEVHDKDGTYSIPDLGINHQSNLDQPAVVALTRCALTGNGAHRWTSADSGFITKGDNNNIADQCAGGITPYPARLPWILGKARGELPWFGLIKLFVDDLRGPSSNFANAGTDSKVMLVVSLGTLIVLPYGVSGVRRRIQRRREGL